MGFQITSDLLAPIEQAIMANISLVVPCIIFILAILVGAYVVVNLVKYAIGRLT